MSHRIGAICQPAVAPGLRLAGLRTQEAAGPAEAAELLGALCREADVGVVLIEADLHDALPAPLRRELARRVLPLIVPFPAPRWTAVPEAEAFVAELLRQAIGYRVRLG